MKQLKVKVLDTNGSKDWGYKKVMSMHWNINGKLYLIMVDFMESGSDFSAFYNYTGEFINRHGNLKAKFDQ